MKKIMSMLLAVVMMFTIAGCGKNEKDPKVLFEDAMNKMQKLESSDLSIDTDMIMSYGDESIEMSMKMDAMIQDIGKETMKLSMPMTMELLGQSVSMNVYYTDNYYYMDMFGSKMKTPMDLDEIQENLESSTGITNLSAETIKEFSMEEKDGSYVISFVGDNEKMTDYTEAVIASMESMYGLDSTSFTLNEIKGTVTINKAGYITEQVVEMGMNMELEGEVVATSVVTTVTYNNPGEDVTIEFPDFSEYEEVSLTE